MKNIIWICLCFLVFQQLEAQITINRTINRSYKDKWSQGHYSDINKFNAERVLHTTANAVFVKQLHEVIEHQHDELKDFASAFIFQRNTLTNFVKGSSFNATSGYSSYGYIQEKYPIINLINPGDVFRNTIIRARFFRKLNKESQNISDYFSTDNPIPEGERILLALDALETVIKITLEDETY